jgi:hypothetical protein
MSSIIIPTATMVMQAYLNGNVFSATTGKLTSAATAVTGLAVFNPLTSGKTCVFLSARGATAGAGGGGHQLNIVTSDPALGTTVTPTNSQGKSSLTSSATCSSANAAVTLSGTQYDSQQSVGNVTFEFLNGDTSFLICPPGSGLLIGVSTASTVWYASTKWIEL